MNEKKNKNLVITIVGLLIIIIVMIVFVTVNSIKNSDRNIDKKQQTSDVTEQKAKQIYKEIVRPIMISGITYGKVESFSSKDISAVVAAYSEDSDYIQNLCGTNLEKELISDQIIAKKDEGQFDCEYHRLMTVQKFKEVVKRAFGPTFNKELDFSSFEEYYQNHQLIRSYFQGEVLIEYNSYELKDNILTIKALLDSGSIVVSFDFIIDGNNYYLSEVKSSFAESKSEIKMTLGNSYTKTDITNFIIDYNDKNEIIEGSVKFIEVDIDEDGNKDLIVTNGDTVDEASAIGFFFRNDASNYIYIGSLGVGHSGYSKEKGKPYINKLYGHMGYWSMYKISIENDVLKIEEISHGEITESEEYPKLPGDDLNVK